MDDFWGSTEHSLDAKGRLILPAKFRAPLADGAVLSIGKQRCLAVYTREEWREMSETPIEDAGRRRERAAKALTMARIVLRLALPVTPTSQGRVAIRRRPARLRAARREGGRGRRVHPDRDLGRGALGASEKERGADDRSPTCPCPVSVADAEREGGLASRGNQREQSADLGPAASPPAGAVKPLLRPLLPSRFGETTERHRRPGGSRRARPWT